MVTDGNPVVLHLAAKLGGYWSGSMVWQNQRNWPGFGDLWSTVWLCGPWLSQSVCVHVVQNMQDIVYSTLQNPRYLSTITYLQTLLPLSRSTIKSLPVNFSRRNADPKSVSSHTFRQLFQKVVACELHKSADIFCSHKILVIMLKPQMSPQKSALFEVGTSKRLSFYNF